MRGAVSPRRRSRDQIWYLVATPWWPFPPARKIALGSLGTLAVVVKRGVPEPVRHTERSAELPIEVMLRSGTTSLMKKTLSEPRRMAQA